MRLIDADEIDFSKVFVGASEFAQDTRNAAQMLIDRQPTAYDVDKVIEQLKAEESRYKAQALKADDTTDIMRCCMGESAIQTAIEIVKAALPDIVKAVSDDKISAIGSMIGAMAEARIQNELDKRYNNLEIQVEEDPIKKLLGMSSLLSDLSFECPEPPKQNITTLKKRIKYCKNPLKRKKLEQELNTLYKEQKKIR